MIGRTRCHSASSSSARTRYALLTTEAAPRQDKIRRPDWCRQTGDALRMATAGAARPLVWAAGAAQIRQPDRHSGVLLRSQIVSNHVASTYCAREPRPRARRARWTHAGSAPIERWHLGCLIMAYVGRSLRPQTVASPVGDASDVCAAACVAPTGRLATWDSAKRSSGT
jgi:hypothetical protein